MLRDLVRLLTSAWSRRSRVSRCLLEDASVAPRGPRLNPNVGPTRNDGVSVWSDIANDLCWGTTARPYWQDVVKSGLRRFWFPVPGHLGIGVTAWTRAEAVALALDTAAALRWQFDAGEVVEDVDIRTLDQGHVIPTMGVCSDRGVWFPRR